MFIVSFLLPTPEQHVSCVWFSLVNFTECGYTQFNTDPYNCRFCTVKLLIYKKTTKTVNKVGVMYKLYLLKHGSIKVLFHHLKTRE